MMRDTLSRREDRALLKALRELARTRFPNPDRKNCPGTSVLHAIATKRISMVDPAHEHVARCSPCFRELMDMRRTLQRRRMFFWAMGTTATATVLFGIWLTYFGSRGPDGTVRPPVARSESPSESSRAVQPGNAAQTPAPTPPPQPNEALLDLRNASVSRSVGSLESNSNMPPIEIHRGLLALTVQLPTGSDVGLYEVEIRDSNQQPIRAARGRAEFQNGITKLLLNVDLQSVRPGEYEFRWRPADLSWRSHQILVR